MVLARSRAQTDSAADIFARVVGSRLSLVDNDARL
jgi:hypothetical protein